MELKKYEINNYPNSKEIIDFLIHKKSHRQYLIYQKLHCNV